MVASLTNKRNCIRTNGQSVIKISYVVVAIILVRIFLFMLDFTTVTNSIVNSRHRKSTKTKNAMTSSWNDNQTDEEMKNSNLAEIINITDTSHKHSEIDSSSNTNYNCPKGFSYVNDRITSSESESTNSNNASSSTQFIPNIIHFIVPSRCLPLELVSNLQKWYEYPQLSSYSFYFHDPSSVYSTLTYLSSTTKHFRSSTYPLFTMYACSPQNKRARRDLARLLILYRFGGISVDIDYLPGPALFLSKAGKTIIPSSPPTTSTEEENNDNNRSNKHSCLLQVFSKEISWTTFPYTAKHHFMACAAHHPALIRSITILAASVYWVDKCQDICSYDGQSHFFDRCQSVCTYESFQDKLYLGNLISQNSDEPNWNALLRLTTEGNITKSGGRGLLIHQESQDGFLASQPIGINVIPMQTDLFVKVYFNTTTYEAIDKMEANDTLYRLDNDDKHHNGNDRHIDMCKSSMNVLENIPSIIKTNITSLLELVGPYNIADETSTTIIDTTHAGNEQCEDIKKLMYVQSIYNPSSILPTHRKIPKIIHMTSKSHCFTDGFRNNIDKWRFPHHSFLLHDNDAMDRLFFHKTWSEFPLLKEALGCIVSGAGRADLWRYLILWEYGGIYTDIDNAPGPLFANGTVITDSIDALLEVEMGSFPSQYFMAASPRHPVMYMMVATTIRRLLDVSRINKQYVPVVTGPGATKSAVIETIGGQGRRQRAGTYEGIYNRTVTMIGSVPAARQGMYLIRDSYKKSGDIIQMNMTDYDTETELSDKSHSCYLEIYKSSMFLNDIPQYDHNGFH